MPPEEWDGYAYAREMHGLGLPRRPPTGGWLGLGIGAAFLFITVSLVVWDCINE
jgi:hypothetical protein